MKKFAGVLNPHAKLSPVQVREIRTRHQSGKGESVASLAREYGVAATTLGLIVTGRTWPDVGGPVRPPAAHRLTHNTAHYCSVDGYELEHESDGYGVLLIRCVACERRRERRCMDCGAKVQGKAWRCAVDAALCTERSVAECRTRYRAEYNRRQRDRYRKYRGAKRRAHLEYKRQWRQKNRMKVLMQKRRARLRGCGGFATREKYLAYHRAYRERRKALGVAA